MGISVLPVAESGDQAPDEVTKRVSLQMNCGLTFLYTGKKYGDYRARTCDPLHVKQVLSQLS